MIYDIFVGGAMLIIFFVALAGFLLVVQTVSWAIYSKIKLHKTIRTFCNSTSSDEVSRAFIELLNLGYFSSLRETTKNRVLKNKDLISERQRDTFVKYLTPEITEAAKKISEENFYF